MTESETGASNRNVAEETNRGCAIERDDSGTLSDRWTDRAWSSGSYPEIAPKYAPMGGHLVERTDVSPDDDVLDVGCGTGTVAIAAARRGARAIGVDITPSLLERARNNADVAGVDNTSWREGDATALPFDDDAFDVTLSNLGHMYGDPPDLAARELLRVTRPGGRIGFTSWTPASLYPSMAGVVVTVLSPDDLPDFSEPPFLWGDSGTVRRRLGESVEGLDFETGTVQYPALSPEHFWQQTATNSGMFVQVLEEVDDDVRPKLRDQVIDTIEPYFDDRTNAVELEYLLATATVTTSG